MSLLDKVQSPLYDIVIPSTKKKVKFRPFYVREERALLSAYESDNEETMVNTLLAVVSATIQPQEAVADGLTTYDVEFLFTHIRAKSVGEFSNLLMPCTECDLPNNKAPLKVDLRTVEVFYPNPNTDGIVKLNDRVSVKIVHPKLGSLNEIMGEKTDDEKTRLALLAAIETIFIEDEAYHSKEEPAEEIAAFIDMLPSKEYVMLEEYLDATPYARIPVEYVCPACGAHHKTFIKGLKNFF